MRRHVIAVLPVIRGTSLPPDGIARAHEAMTKHAKCEVVNVKYRHREPHADHPNLDLLVYRGTALTA